MSSGYALGLGLFTTINPWHLCCNYYLKRGLATLCILKISCPKLRNVAWLIKSLITCVFLLTWAHARQAVADLEGDPRVPWIPPRRSIDDRNPPPWPGWRTRKTASVAHVSINLDWKRIDWQVGHRVSLSKTIENGRGLAESECGHKKFYVCFTHKDETEPSFTKS